MLPRRRGKKGFRLPRRPNVPASDGLRVAQRRQRHEAALFGRLIRHVHHQSSSLHRMYLRFEVMQDREKADVNLGHFFNSGAGAGGQRRPCRSGASRRRGLLGAQRFDLEGQGQRRRLQACCGGDFGRRQVLGICPDGPVLAEDRGLSSRCRRDGRRFQRGVRLGDPQFHASST